MKKILKNPLRQNLKTHFRGRDIVFKSKSGKAFDMDNEEQVEEYRHWVKTYEFLYEVKREGV
jgi:hypothetical protein